LRPSAKFFFFFFYKKCFEQREGEQMFILVTYGYIYLKLD